MGLFGGSKNSNTTTTYATQTSVGVTDDAIVAEGSSIDQSADNSVHYLDSRDQSLVVNDSSSTVEQHFDSSPEVISAVLQFADNTNARNLAGVGALLDTGLSTTREISNAALAASRDLANQARSYLGDTVKAVSQNNEQVLDAITKSNTQSASYLDKATTAIVNANRSDGEAILSTVSGLGKMIAFAIVGVALAAAAR